MSTATGQSRRQSALREQESRIIEAASAEFRRSGIKNADIERIARDAGVSRATVYRRFANREELLAEVVARLRLRLLQEVADRVAGLDTKAVVIEAFTLAMIDFRHDELLHRILGYSPDAVDALIGIASPQVEDMIGEFVRRIAITLRSSGAGMPDDELRQASEILVRLAISLMSARATALDTNDEAAVRAFAQTFLAPMVW
jgi:AcrR family transcriptional regulator